MIRTITKSNQNSVTITLPDELVGKLIEVIAFEVTADGEVENFDLKLKPSQLRGFLSQESSRLMHEHIKQSRKEWDTL